MRLLFIDHLHKTLQKDKAPELTTHNRTGTICTATLHEINLTGNEKDTVKRSGVAGWDFILVSYTECNMNETWSF